MPAASDEGRGVTCEVRDAVAWISLDRGSRGNAINNETLQQLTDVVRDVGLRSDMRVMVFRGGGERPFGSGMDLNDLRAMSPAGVQHHFDRLNACLNAIETAPVPSIAMVRGYAVGGGCELAAACDLRVAAVSARIGIPIGRIGHCPDRENLRRLVRIVGPGVVKAMIMADVLLSANEAQRAGFFQWVVPDPELETFTSSLAETVSGKAPLGLRTLKAALGEVLEGSIAPHENPERDLVTSLFRTQDFQEGVSAFLERRKPAFAGR